jgi:hypothetical protein
VLIRAAEPSDRAALRHLQQERAVLLIKSDARYRARIVTPESLAARIGQPGTPLLVGVSGEQVVGYAAGWSKHSPYGDLPDDTLLVDDMALDAHRYYGGLARALIQRLRDQAPGGVRALVPRYYPVEQAFWRALGAVPCTPKGLARILMYEWMCL